MQRVFVLLTLVLAMTDMLLVIVSLSIAYNIRFNTALLPVPDQVHAWESYWGVAAVEVGVFFVVFAARDVYRVRRNASRLDELQQAVIGVAIGALVTLGIVAFFVRDFPYSRSLLALSWIIAVPLIWLSHLLQFWLQGLLRRWGWGTQRVLIVGSGQVAQAVLEKMQGVPASGYDVVGYIADGKAPSLDSLPSLGHIDAVGTVVREYGVTEVIVADPSMTHQQLVAVVERLDPKQVSIRVFPDVFQLMSSRVTISDLHGLPLISVRDAALRGWQRAIKRMVDALLSAALLVLLSPLMLLIAILIKLTSPQGPVLYLQERIGLDGKSFWVIKFRSMGIDAEKGTGPVWATRGDPRATGLGRLLRRFSLDEVPQFVNVLLGDMSIVGPRPERPHFVRQFSRSIPHYQNRYREKAGLTGWAQVNGLRGDTSIEERTAYDLWYVENWTLWLDFKIMVRTVFAIFRHSNG